MSSFESTPKEEPETESSNEIAGVEDSEEKEGLKEHRLSKLENDIAVLSYKINKMSVNIDKILEKLGER